MVSRRLRPDLFLDDRFAASVVYGAGASVLVAAGALGALLVASFWVSRGTSAPPDLLAGNLCTKPGVRYHGRTVEGVSVCFTLSADRSAWVEIGWRFASSSGCPGGSRAGWAGATSYDWGNALAGPGQISEPGFTATIRGARALGMLKDPSVCPGKRFAWSAREVVP
jgi:hypothetical protein